MENNETTKVCKCCGDELPISQFKIQRGCVRSNTCTPCWSYKIKETKRLHSAERREQPFYDAEFDGKQPVEVIQLMSRAKKWLESRGYEITLRGKYTVTKEVKF